MNENTIACRHFDLADNFFDLVEAVLNESIIHENITFGVFDADSEINEIQMAYRQMTRWSDSRIIIPILFNFFHGCELYMKAAYYLLYKPNDKPTHKLSGHFEIFKKCYPSQTKLIDILEYYIFPDNKCELLFNFYKTNGLANSSDFYEVFKYPYNKNFDKPFNYKDLRNTEDKGLVFFRTLLDNIISLRHGKSGL
jgi:hypothetical protein